MAFDELPHHAGWYRDPESIGERWWNGSQWTSHTRPDAFADGAVSLDGLPPKAWSAADWTTTDAPPVTALQPTALPPVAAYPPMTAGTTAFAVDGPLMPAMPPTPQAIAPGWYPDPQGLPAQRWWDGTAWTEHSAPVGGYAPPRQVPVYQNYPPPYGSTTVVVLPPQKSVGLAFILTFFFGPLGMLYSTVSGAMIMMGVAIIGGFFVAIATLGLGLVLYWPLVWVASIVWGCVAAGNQQGPHVVNTYR
jgi:hypothetical protein